MNNPDPNGTEATPQAASLAFPNGPRLELDELLTQLVGRAQDVLATQGRLRGLLAANRMIIGDLDLPTVLRHIVEAGCQLTGARYGAIGVLAPDGGLQEFIHVGIDAASAELIGPLPSGKGLLGALIEDARPIRLAAMTDDARSIGFPPNHPPMAGFLGVPIRVRDAIYGNLYLTEASNGEFTAEDTELVLSLAASAGIAIDNARLFAESERRQRWLQASMQITRHLLSAEGAQPLQLIADLTAQIADANIVTVVLRTPDLAGLMVEVVAGDAQDLVGYRYPITSSLAARAFASAESILVPDSGDTFPASPDLNGSGVDGPVMIVPLIGAAEIRGAVVVGRARGRAAFDTSDLTLATTFANHAAVALELADARIDQQRITLLEDRDRIARDLHDHVIQQLFAVGLTVQSVAKGLPADGIGSMRLERAVANIDQTISQIRTSIFQLRGALGPATGSVRATVLSVVAELSPLLGFQPAVRFSGSVDARISEAVSDDLAAVAREALTNVARHADATCVDIELTSEPNCVTLTVSDDGCGIGAVTRRSGLANLGRRAELRGGTLAIEAARTSSTNPGTQLTWTIPLI